MRYPFYMAMKPGRVSLVLLSLFILGQLSCSYAVESISGFEKFRKFKQIYEPSGVQQLSDGRFVVVEDEAYHPMSVFLLEPDGKVSEQPLYRSSLFSWSSPNRALNTLEDLEAIAVDEQDRLYVITSHSRKESGKRADKREQLARFALDEEQIVDFQVLRGLRKKISAQHKLLKGAAKIRDVKDSGGFNIEGLSFDGAKEKLLIGLRSPLIGPDAIIVVLENPQAVFDQDEDPRFSERMITLDLNGGGIRAMCYDPHLGGFLIISRKPEKSFKLWLWSGNADQPAKRIKIPDIKNLRRAEGVTPVRVNALPLGLLIVSDDGQGLRSKPGHYLFLRYEQLAIE